MKWSSWQGKGGTSRASTRSDSPGGSTGLGHSLMSMIAVCVDVAGAQSAASQQQRVLTAADLESDRRLELERVRLLTSGVDEDRTITTAAVASTDTPAAGTSAAAIAGATATAAADSDGISLSCSLLHIPSVLWRCWLGGRKGIRPVKNWVVGCWCGCLFGERCRLAYGPADATATHCLLLQ